jgi:hypothetical protein
VRVALLLLILAPLGIAQSDEPDGSKLELALSYWPVRTNGTIRASGTPVDFRSDLGVDQNTATFAGKLDVRPGRRHWVRIEGSPIRLEGRKDLSRTITYQGRTYSLNDRVTSTASLDYLYAGYQFDVLSRPTGHLGLQAGAAYLNATGSITSQTTSLRAAKSQSVGLPVAGLAFRLFPVHGAIDIALSGELKGMKLGRYGDFVQAEATAGVGKGHFFIEAGYRFLKADIHDSPGLNQAAPTFCGPIVSLRFRL